MRRLLGLLLLLGLAEIFTIVFVADRIGAIPTFLTMIVTSAAGAWLAKRQGATAWRKVRQTADAGRLPAVELVDAVLVFIAGLFLLLPGFLSDIVGLVLAIGPVRKLVAARALVVMAKRVRVSPVAGTVPGFGFGGPSAPGAPFGRPGDSTTRPGWVRSDDIIDLDGEEYYVDEPRGEIGRG